MLSKITLIKTEEYPDSPAAYEDDEGPLQLTPEATDINTPPRLPNPEKLAFKDSHRFVPPSPSDMLSPISNALLKGKQRIPVPHPPRRNVDLTEKAQNATGLNHFDFPDQPKEESDAKK